MTLPKRIQLRRTKGWRKPEGAVVVSRPSRWGNPFVVGQHFVNRGPWGPAPYPHPGPRSRRLVRGGFGDSYTEIVTQVMSRTEAVSLFRQHIRYEDLEWDPSVIAHHLSGHDLACWCPLDQPCHADVLLEVANR